MERGLGEVNVWLLGLIVVLAAIVGDSVGYEIGRIWGSRIIAHSFFDKRRRQLDNAQAFLRRRGGSAVFLGLVDTAGAGCTGQYSGLGTDD